MNWLNRRRLRKRIKNIDFDNWLKTYGNTGEYEAWMWLKSYSEDRASAEPMQLIKSVLNNSSKCISSKDRDYIRTLLEWC